MTNNDINNDIPQRPGGAYRQSDIICFLDLFHCIAVDVVMMNMMIPHRITITLRNKLIKVMKMIPWQHPRQQQHHLQPVFVLVFVLLITVMKMIPWQHPRHQQHHLQPVVIQFLF